jgi:formyl-CoA transferase
MDTQDVFHDPHLTERGFVREIPHPEHGSVLLLDKPFRLEKSNVPLQAAPMLGADTDSVLSAELGLTADELTALRADRVIA